jgi:CheY-like chemotaxis protein
VSKAEHEKVEFMVNTPNIRFKILVAEDEKAIAELVSLGLNNAGHAVDVVHDGQAALHKITERKQHYDLLITDNNMPRLSGYQLIQQLRSDGFQGKIIVASSSVTPEMETAYRSKFVDVIVAKPYRIADLCEAVEHLANP